MKIGCDILETKRIKLDMAGHILSSCELKDFLKLKEEEKQQFLASRFSIKEALFKAGLKKPMTSITIIKESGGSLSVLNENYSISLSHDGGFTMAVAIRTSENPCKS